MAAFVLNIKLFFRIFRFQNRNLNSNGSDIENLSTEILPKHSISILVQVIYRLHRGIAIEFINTINELFKNMHEKPLLLVGDLNLSSLDYSKSVPVTSSF